MEKITLLFFFFIIVKVNAQSVINYTPQLKLIEGVMTIDGAKLNPNDRFANLKANEMTFADKSAINLVNCVIKVNGPVDASTNCRIRLINSYIICKQYKGPKSDRIIVTNYIKNCRISEVKYLKKLKGNPEIEIIDKSGNVVAKGYKKDISSDLIKTGVYDIRSKGNFYNSNVLLAGE